MKFLILILGLLACTAEAQNVTIPLLPTGSAATAPDLLIISQSNATKKVTAQSLAQALPTIGGDLYRLKTSASDTITSGTVYGIGWADGLMTVQTPVAALQFDETGTPAEPVMVWPGRIVANHIDVTSLSLFTTAPATATSLGEPGQMAYDSSYFYVCVASNTWKRAALSTW